MSWLSRIKNNFIALATGGSATLPIVNNPTTPVEKALNAAAAVVLPVAAALPGANTVALEAKTISQAVDSLIPKGTSVGDPIGNIAAVIGQGAHAAIDGFLIDHLGPQSVTFTDSALTALATIALSRTQAAQGTSPNALGAALGDFLAGFASAPAAPAPAPVAAPKPLGAPA